MPAPDTIDNYFTRSIVGPATAVVMGPGETARNLPERGSWLEATRSGAELVHMAGRSLLGADPEGARVARPVSPLRLSRVRWQVGLLALAAWSALLWGLFVVIHR